MNLYKEMMKISYSEDDCKRDTLDHINQVRQCLNIVSTALEERGKVHDKSKLESPELEIFTEYTPKLANSTYGSSEYKGFLTGMQEGLKHHYANNRHHPEWEDFNKLEWKDIEGYEGLYQISNHGDVKSLSRTVKRSKQGNFNRQERTMRAHVTPKGYLRTQLSKEGVVKNFMVHRLVASHFLENPKNKPQVNHKDTNKKNNYYKNLEWCDNSENQLHAYDNGLQVIKYVVHCVDLNLTTLGTGEMARELKRLGYEKARESTILACINGESAHHLGLRFEGYITQDYARSKLSNMNILDIIEMFCDWKAATMRHNDGDIRKSIEINQERFGYSDDLKSVFLNSVDIFD